MISCGVIRLWLAWCKNHAAVPAVSDSLTCTCSLFALLFNGHDYVRPTWGKKSKAYSSKEVMVWSRSWKGCQRCYNCCQVQSCVLPRPLTFTATIASELRKSPPPVCWAASDNHDLLFQDVQYAESLQKGTAKARALCSKRLLWLFSRWGRVVETDVEEVVLLCW